MKLTKQLRPQRLNKRVIWCIICGVVVLGIGLVLLFTIPQSFGQPEAITLAQKNHSIVSNKQSKNGPTPSLSPFLPGSYNAINSRLFSNTSPWNVPIGTNVQFDPNSSQMINQLAACCHVPTMFNYGMPIYTSTASDPTYKVLDDDTVFESYQPIHIPNNAAPAPGSDKWMFIYDKTKNLIFEMWQAQKQGNTWTANTGDVYTPTGDGVHQVDGSPQAGNGDSYFGGVITHTDIERGFINHALSLVTEYTSSSWRYPMNASDGNGSAASDLPMGARLQLDPSVDCNALAGTSMGEKMVCQALKTYGGYIRDTGGVTLSIYFEGENLTDPGRNPPDGSPGDPGRTGSLFDTVGLHDNRDLSDIPWEKMHVLKAWNSFTPLHIMPSSVFNTLSYTQGSRSSSLHEGLDLPNTTRLALGKAASRRRWPNSTRKA